MPTQSRPINFCPCLVFGNYFFELVPDVMMQNRQTMDNIFDFLFRPFLKEKNNKLPRLLLRRIIPKLKRVRYVRGQLNLKLGNFNFQNKFFLKVGHSQLLFVYFRLFNTVDSKQVNKCSIKNLPITGFEPWTSVIGSNCCTNWATTTAQNQITCRKNK